MDLGKTGRAKAELKAAGWTYDQRRRKWTYRAEATGMIFTAPSLHQALKTHRAVQAELERKQG